MNDLKEYLPIVTALLGAFLAHFFSNRKYRAERFHKDALESLEEFYSPVYHEMRSIKNALEGNKDIEPLSELIANLVNKDTKIYKSYNQKLIEMVYKIDEKLKTYNIKKRR